MNANEVQLLEQELTGTGMRIMMSEKINKYLNCLIVQLGSHGSASKVR
jgi:hypothetical protein